VRWITLDGVAVLTYLTLLTVSAEQGRAGQLVLCGSRSSLPSTLFAPFEGFAVRGDGFWVRLVLGGACCLVEGLSCVGGSILGLVRVG